MALNPSNSSNLEQLALKGLIANTLQAKARPRNVSNRPAAFFWSQMMTQIGNLWLINNSAILRTASAESWLLYRQCVTCVHSIFSWCLRAVKSYHHSTLAWRITHPLATLSRGQSKAPQTLAIGSSFVLMVPAPLQSYFLTSKLQKSG